MSESFVIELGGSLPLSMTLPSVGSGLFPRVVIYDSADAPVAGSPFDLTEVGATARYTGASFTPLAVGTFTAWFVVYADALHTIEAFRFSRDQDSYVVVPRAEGTACHIVVAFGETTNDLRIKAWLDRGGVTVVAPTAITIVWRDIDSTILFTLTIVDALPGQNPDAQGVFAFSPTQALADDVTYYADVTITDAVGVVSSKRGIETIA